MDVERMDTFQNAPRGEGLWREHEKALPPPVLLLTIRLYGVSSLYDHSATLWTFTKSQTLSLVLACLTKAVSRMASPMSLKAISPDTPV